ncbi:putative short-chain dehydrogenase reductase sdr protein [Botrytis fragariae]|uniref:Short-chain dehydrogenase/reductase ABA4 n=1 Tax=Botrytis fragariae TaxID=1964551 RepID=A0A8H6EGN6_9HELO|nr:putative short-chain dehydrogenase reductase sdr protein [Botrytis fragariae]KAF5871441.1 putative short-chain dehydrogenase reductase sdr protein [Botrytis fragariae]
MPPSFQNKTILITGAGSGIGRATAIKLASLGASLYLSDINLDSVSKTRELCPHVESTSKQDFHIHTLDVSDSQACNTYILDLVCEHNTIDHVFNCAGINPTAIPIEDITDEYWDRLMNVNLKGTFNITRAAAPHLTSGSSFVNVSSVCGMVPVSQFSVYCATKYAVVGFSKCMALELGARGIRTNVVAPGYIDTPTNVSVLGEKRR